MNRIIYALFGLIVAASVEAGPNENLRTFSVADSSQSFCSQCSKIMAIQADIERKITEIKSKKSEEKHTIFSLPSGMTNCRTDNYSFLGKNFVRTKLLSGSEILFPTDGCQMDSEEVVQLSGANLEDGLVTKFYMAAFGLIKWEGEYLEMGFDEDNLACRVFNLSSLDKQTRRAFTTNFRKIASNSVGRTLLYRLLLEIRRTDTEGNGRIDETIRKVLKTRESNQRNKCRTLKVLQLSGNSFKASRHYISFRASKDAKETNAISSEISEKVSILRCARTDDVGLFHEMLHWFHSLRDPERKKRETTLKHLPSSYQSDILLKSKEIGTDKLSMWAYENHFGLSKKLVIEIEEFRTIMGYVPTICLKTGKLETVLYAADESIYGDDLSENLYRKCTEQALRYGHIEATDGDSISKELAENIDIFYENAIKQGHYRIAAR